MIDIYMLPASIDNGTQGPVTVLPFPRSVHEQARAQGHMVMTWAEPAAQQIDDWRSKWDGRSGFWCTTTLPAPMKIQSS